MHDLSTRYMGLTLKNPIIVGSSGLTRSVEDIKLLEKEGAAAVVLKSIFEEQILMESKEMQSSHATHAEEYDYIYNYTRQHDLGDYIKLIKNAKAAVSIPVIASINCISSSGWTEFAEKIQQAGADALELNMFIIPADHTQRGEDIEQIYFDIINEVRKHTSMPIAVKISYFFSGLANTIYNLSVRKINGLVLFNRFYKPDIDLERIMVVPSDVYSTPGDETLPLQWIALLSDHAKCDLAASTGIHDGNAVIKNILAGAKAVEIASAIYKNGPGHIGIMLKQITSWMEKHNFATIREITGKLSHKNIENPVLYERSQFMKYFSSATASAE